MDVLNQTSPPSSFPPPLHPACPAYLKPVTCIALDLLHQISPSPPLQVVKQCVTTEGVESDYIKTDILPDFFKAFWNRRMALDRCAWGLRMGLVHGGQ